VTFFHGKLLIESELEGQTAARLRHGLPYSLVIFIGRHQRGPGEMTKLECRMTKEARMTKSEERGSLGELASA
jgi:hypothetical protein